MLGSASGVKVSFVNDALESDAVLHLSGEVDQSQNLKVVVTNTYNSSSLKINSCAKIESLSSVAIEMQDHLQGVILNPKGMRLQVHYTGLSFENTEQHQLVANNPINIVFSCQH